MIMTFPYNETKIKCPLYTLDVVTLGLHIQRGGWSFISVMIDNFCYLLWNIFDVDGVKETCPAQHKQWLLY